MNTTETVSETTLRRREAHTKARNEAFQKLTKAEQRVEIAKDVIRALNSRKLIAESGVFFKSNEDGVFNVVSEQQQLKDAFHDDKIEKCHVCALGAVFVEAAKHDDEAVNETGYVFPDYNNNNKMRWSNNSERMRQHLKKYFSYTQLAMIENAFEQDNCVYNENCTRSVGGASFAKDVESDSKRMKLIMQNIIDNDGTFKPNAEKVTRRKPALKKTALKKKNARLGRN